MADLPTRPYIGRFAPSPTGPLHLGSLLAALASYLDARAHGGCWLLRIEDIDPPREMPGATVDILRCLEAHHLYWDGAVLSQHARHEAYTAALAEIARRGLSYRCTCSRQATSSGIYPGTCRLQTQDPLLPAAQRLNLARALQESKMSSHIVFQDLFRREQHQDLLQEVGDFVIHRKDGLFAYQLAVVIDDLYQGITHVIRGADLLDSTARQILLFRLLGTREPRFGHLPLILNREGQKFSKQNKAPALNPKSASDNLWQALNLLQQAPPAELRGASPADLLGWAYQHWQRTSVPAQDLPAP